MKGGICLAENKLSPDLKEVIDSYGWEPISVNLVKDVWKVRCSEGSYALKQSKMVREKILILHKILEKVRLKFPHVLPWMETKEGMPVATIRDKNWYATPWKSIEDENKTPISPLEIVKSLALFHRCCEPLVKPYTELYTSFTSQDLDNWKAKQTRLSQYKEMREAREFKSPFDKKLEKNEENIEKSIYFSIRGMGKFLELDDGKAPRYTLCHKRISQSHIIQDEEGFYFINFDHAQVDSPIRDLGTCIRRLVGKSTQIGPLELIKAYESENKLLLKERKLLALYLAYPDKILKTIYQYYDGKKYYHDELNSIKRLEKEVAKLETMQESIKTLWITKNQPTSKDQRKSAFISKDKKTYTKQMN